LALGLGHSRGRQILPASRVTALAGESVVLTPQIVSVTITSSADSMFPSGDWKLPNNAPLLDKMVPTLSKFRTTKIVVRGYTDNTPIGQPLQAAGVTDNLDLSAGAP
jgi:chemotaxis protein MotB